MRAVIDANVFISGLMLPNSTPGQVMQVWRTGHFHLVLSEPMLEKVGTVLAYPKICKRPGLGRGHHRSIPDLAAL